jgi:hypothetical protein
VNSLVRLQFSFCLSKCKCAILIVPSRRQLTVRFVSVLCIIIILKVKETVLRELQNLEGISLRLICV